MFVYMTRRGGEGRGEGRGAERRGQETGGESRGGEGRREEGRGEERTGQDRTGQERKRKKRGEVWERKRKGKKKTVFWVSLCPAKIQMLKSYCLGTQNVMIFGDGALKHNKGRVGQMAGPNTV